MFNSIEATWGDIRLTGADQLPLMLRLPTGRIDQSPGLADGDLL
jgi:hypothetical protein